MKKNKKIIKYCPNFYKIINFEYLEDDYITHKLISIYEDFIFNYDSTEEEITKLDYAVNKYIDDYFFRKEMKIGLSEMRVRKNSNIVKSVVEGVIRLCDNYDMGFTRNIYFARWI